MLEFYSKCTFKLRYVVIPSLRSILILREGGGLNSFRLLEAAK